MGLTNRFRKAVNAFLTRDPTTQSVNTDYQNGGFGVSYSRRPDRVLLSNGNDRSIVTTVYNRIATDVSELNICHCVVDEDDNYKETIKNSDLNKIFKLSANKDQTGRAFIKDATLSMLDEGVIALVPIDTDDEVAETDSYKIISIRTAKILEWKPDMIKVRVYDDNSGNMNDIWVYKRACAIIENPFYSVMNERNSTLQRLIRKLALLDFTDEKTASGKIDMIVQLPYTLKSDKNKALAEERKNSIELQLNDSKYGIAYIDSTEHVTQLNRPIDNNLMSQIEYLTKQLFSQLGISMSILDNTAGEQEQINYYNTIISPIVNVLCDETKRKFISDKGIALGRSIKAFRDPFKYASLTAIADAGDKFKRNEILNSNEIRPKLGYRPSGDPRAQQLGNPNIANANNEVTENQNGNTNPDESVA